MELIERPNQDAVYYLNSISFETFRDDCISDAEMKGDKKPTPKDIKQWHTILKQFCKTNIKTKGITKRIYSYSQTTHSGLGGRLFCSGSLQSIWSVYRGLLMRGIGTDLDMSNAHPVILRYICSLHDIPCPQLEYYINNRDRCLAEFDSREEGKKAYLSAVNSDRYSRCKNAPSSFKRFDDEMGWVQRQIVSIPEYQKIVQTVPDSRELNNFNGSAINRVMCYYENIILGHAIHVINARGLEIAILMFDGLMVYGDLYADCSLLQEIEEYVESKMRGLQMKWAYKQHDTTLEIPEDFVEEVVDEYTEWKHTFELEWCKIKNVSTFVQKTTINGRTSLVLQNESNLIVSYKHECYFKTDEKGKQKRVSFINEWILDSTMRCYDAMESIPPPLKCPDNIFNTWIDSLYESQEIQDDDPEFDLDAVTLFTHHLELLSGNNREAFEYVINWVAQSIQRPAEKMGVALNFISDQGVGKNIFTDILAKLYGGKKLETAQPERDVWGPFNELLLDSYLIVLSETDKRNSIGHDGKIKAIITDDIVTVNPKGKKGFALNSYHRIIQNTNNEDPTTTSKSDRRNVIIRCSDEMKGNTEYFTTLLNAMQRPMALRSIYWTLKRLDISEFKKGYKIETQYHTDLMEHNENPLDLFMKWIVENNTGVLKLKPVELMQMFLQWKEETRFKFGENMNVLSLVKKISLQLKLPEGAFESSHTRMGNVRTIDTEKLAIHYYGPVPETPSTNLP